jgi:hypothetical protein
MAKQPLSPLSLANEIAYYLTMIDVHTVLPLNAGLSSAKEETMISILGSPLMPLTTADQPSKASPLVTRLKQTEPVGRHVVVTGIRPAIASLEKVLQLVSEQEKATGHDLESVLGTEGMLVVRLRKPTSGAVSHKISNHSWGTAIDFKIIGHSAPANTGHTIPRFVAVMLKAFHGEGWFTGIAFNDTMHFEVADETIRHWSKTGLLA